jgi:hypothetical protein
MTTEHVFAKFPLRTTGVEQLVWLIRAAAEEKISPDDLIKSFRVFHEAVEQAGGMRQASPEEARLIWDVVWDLMYYSSDPSQEADPEEWRSLDSVMSTVRRSAQKLNELTASQQQPNYLQ